MLLLISIDRSDRSEKYRFSNYLICKALTNMIALLYQKDSKYVLTKLGGLDFMTKRDRNEVDFRGGHQFF